MYISGITINGFRNFKDKEVLFNDGINVIIGHNNSGKTNLIKALSLVAHYAFRGLSPAALLTKNAAQLVPVS